MNVGYWHRLDNGRIQCDLCPRHCQLSEGQKGVCFVRSRANDTMVLDTYGRSSGFCVDPVEKKPLHHFLPGTPILSFGTAGCNLTCKFCQNWDISKSTQMDRLADRASPEEIARMARASGSVSVAYTYNDPVIFLEYAVDVAAACHEKGIRSVAVTAGYIDRKPAEFFFRHMDAANVDLKSFSETFYHRLCGGHLQPVLDLLQYLVHETRVWVELTTLLIPGANDSSEELDAMTQWIVQHLGTGVPLHFSAFHPDWNMRHLPPTPLATLTRACDIARNNGIHHVYAGNVRDRRWGSTYCHECDQLLIERSGYTLGAWNLDPLGRCRFCQTRCPGVFDAKPGTWGARRLPMTVPR
ncbi:MAG: AmmeMemoRadiSam system radical SAM enzyme [Magnetococcales bacterium]|nr:AmmeMemoRadiSam system radical SAM enzyme [Magnetococcales bacterium]MBF0149623.1 AmmeMemoRadiSam system radical SAM enzyme [Magnetococcales bacterium]MBF0172469.1 AmmeMemoRadiSam system radical SAM enzyme [Magnetococcales bacterium]MBF0347554.1 AmmeMemoRadiSam system radical SAM enzyme [Magnetococcales bacterium]MBF0632105.1 AmmeMemoRadiSam system radical SAM enzyme [Magnetococcales bacterium]